MSRVYQVGDWVTYPWWWARRAGGKPLAYGRIEARQQAYKGRPWRYDVAFCDGHDEYGIKGRILTPYRPSPLEIRDWEVNRCLAQLTK